MRRFNIWLAEDDDDDYDFFKTAVDEMGGNHKLTRMNNGLKLVRNLAIVESDPDIVFLDINMPFKNGLECLNEIREIMKKEFLPVIIFTTSSDATIIERAHKAKANGFAIKPSNIELWKIVIEKALFKDWKMGEFERILPH